MNKLLLLTFLFPIPTSDPFVGVLGYPIATVWIVTYGDMEASVAGYTWITANKIHFLIVFGHNLLSSTSNKIL